MNDFLVNNIVPLVATGVFGVLTKAVYPIGEALINLLVKKREQTEQAIISSGHESDVMTAWETWYEIDEKFRITSNITTFLGSKADEFDKLMLKKIPGLSQETLDSLRQAVAGEVNKGKATVLDQSSIIKQLQDSNTSLQNANNQLTVKNTQLENTIAQMQSSVTAAISNANVATASADTIHAATNANVVVNNNLNAGTVVQP